MRQCVHALRTSALAAAAFAACQAQAIEIDTGVNDLQVRWDTTVKYSAAARLKNPSATLIADKNQDDGDRNFHKGLISNRLDLLTEMDASYHGFGVRFSGAAWYDTVYNTHNDNDSPSTVNHTSTAPNEFPTPTRNLHGRKAELLDAFVFGKSDVGDSTLSFRLGRHTVLWGESLFFGANGIAGGQAPVDIVKAQSVPNTQFKELIRPTQQVSGQWQVTPTLAVGAYYQWRWDRNRFPAAGSYFSTIELFGDGSERQFYFGPFSATRAPDVRAKNSGQGGLQLRFRAAGTDYGVYAIRYHDKSPQFYLGGLLAGTPPGVNLPSEFYWVYPQGINAFGASFSRSVGIFNLAGEASIRHNMPLASKGANNVTGAGNNSGNPLYAVGTTAHAQLSWLASLDPNVVAPESSVIGEVAWNRTLSIRKNPDMLNPNTDRDAWNARVIYEPSYRQVVPGMDLSVPVGVGFGIGNSSAVGSAFMGDKTGDMSVGLNVNYLDVWRISLNLTHYFGPAGTFVDAANNTSFKQSLKDRDFVALSVRRTF